MKRARPISWSIRLIRLDNQKMLRLQSKACGFSHTPFWYGEGDKSPVAIRNARAIILSHRRESMQRAAGKRFVGRVALRCRWQMKRSISVCRGRCATQAYQRQEAHRAPQTGLPDPSHDQRGERCDRCLWQIKGAERVAVVGEGQRRNAEDIRRAPQQEKWHETAAANTRSRTSLVGTPPSAFFM